MCIRLFHISHNTLSLRIFCPPTHTNSSVYALSSSCLGTFNRPKRIVNNVYAKLFVCVTGQETHKQERERVNIGFKYFENFSLYIALAMHFTVLRNILKIAHHNLS